MTRERVELLMNRAIDGALSDEDREHLARALNADPLLRGEYDDLQITNANLESMFRQVALPLDFSARVMRRVQDGNVPADLQTDSVRLDSQRMPAIRSSARPDARQEARQVRLRSAQRKVRIYATVATISAAAALLLAIGVLTSFFSRAAQPAGAPGGSTLADDRGGVPRTEGDNRTDPSRSTPKGGEAPKPNGKGASHASSGSPSSSGGPDDDSLPPIVPGAGDEGKSGIDDTRNSSGNGESPAQPLPEGPRETPIEPDPAPPISPEIDSTKPGSSKPETPDDRKTSGTSPERAKLGRMTVLSGKAEIETAEGKWASLSDDSEVFSNSRMRMNVNGLALIQTPEGNVALGKGSRVRLTDAGTFALEEGSITLERTSQSISNLAAVVDDYRFDLVSGCGLVSRKGKSFNVQLVLGSGVLTHGTLGTMSLEAGTELETELAAKAYKQPKRTSQQLPDWSGDSRAITVLGMLEADIAAREFSARERRDLDRGLRSALERVMPYAVQVDSIVAALQYALGNRKLSGLDMVKLVKDIETAFSEVTELTPDVICGHAGRAALVAESQAEWRDYFYRLMRPAVAPKNGTSGTETNDNKLRRADSPARK